MKQYIKRKSKKYIKVGWILSILLSILLLLDGVMKLIQPDEVVIATTALGYSEHSILTIGIILIFSTLLYLYPRTSLIGIIMLTGYLGGAIATHFRVGNPLFSHQLFPVYIIVLLWLSLAMRNHRFKDLIFHKNTSE
jgi:hypothetical protein